MENSSLQSLLSVKQSELEAEYERTKVFPDKLLEVAKKLEKSSHVQRGLIAMRNELILKKEYYNQLKYSTKMREYLLFNLQSRVARMDRSELQRDLLLESQKMIEEKIEDAEEKYKETKYEEETFVYMINSQKTRLKALLVPISEIKQNVDRTSKELHEVTSFLQRDVRKKLSYDREAAFWRAKLLSIRSHRTESINELIKSYKDRQQFLLFIGKEEEEAKVLQRRKEEAEGLLELEVRLKGLRGKR